MFKPDIWVIFVVFSLLPEVLFILQLFWINKFILKFLNRIKDDLTMMGVPFLTLYVSGKFSNSIIKQFFFIELFFSFIVSLFPLIYISLFYWTQIKFISQDQNIFVEQLIYGLSGLYAVILFSLLLLKTRSNHKFRVNYISNNTNIFKKADFSAFYEKVKNIKHELGDTDLSNGMLGMQQKLVYKKLYSKKIKIFNDKYNLYIVATISMIRVLSRFYSKNSVLSYDTFVLAYAKNIFKKIFEYEIQRWYN
ncbi:hypothetical protein ACA758_00700 [Mycoplasmopsis agassizii]|uniref:hypothetical protein n=1 Tax=Mycoplasmopsis agassizii TaxID=33922 RepID=UPI003529988C